MAIAALNHDEAVINGNALMRAEVDRFVDNNKTASLYHKISDCMFWIATTVLAGLAASMLSLTGVVATPLLIAGGVISLATLAGSVVFSRNAAEIESHNSVLESDIDSQNQAHRMVQAFAKAQAHDPHPAGDVPLGAQTGQWAERTASSNGRDMAASNSWVHRVEAQRQAEEKTALDTLLA